MLRSNATAQDSQRHASLRNDRDAALDGLGFHRGDGRIRGGQQSRSLPWIQSHGQGMVLKTSPRFIAGLQPKVPLHCRKTRDRSQKGGEQQAEAQDRDQDLRKREPTVH
jgi:hypothetical protein